MLHVVRVLSPSSLLLLAATAAAQASWQLAYPLQSPPANYQWAAAFDEARGDAIFVFPRDGSSNQGWRWNGTTWSPLATLPPNRVAAYMVWDSVRERVVLWGGQGQPGLMQDMWKWDGTAWTQHFGAVPPGRDGAAVAFDRARGVIVMFGGYGSGQLQDTWEWNGQTWSNPNPVVRPPAREQAAMAFDPVTQRVLLHGGFNSNSTSGRFNDTWTWNGSVWQQHFPTNPPYPRDRPTMVTDVHRARIVLHGGSQYDPQTWQWDGAQWAPSLPGSPGVLLWASGVYDTVRREVVVHGGQASVFGYTNQTWRYRTPTPANAVPFGAGCAGSAGVPALATAPYSLPWLGDTVRTRVAVPAGQLGALFVSSFAQQLPPVDLGVVGMPGCNLLVPTDVVELELAAGGTAQWSLAIPNTLALAGATIHQQAFPTDPAANALGLSASNGLSLTTGIR